MPLFLSESDERHSAQQRGARAEQWGRVAEEIAVEYLIAQGVPITERRWRAGRMELDIISQQGDEMVFIEVKSRLGKYENPEDAITPEKIKRIVRAADAYLKSLEHDFYARFDVVLVEGDEKNHTVHYIKDAFYPPLITTQR